MTGKVHSSLIHTVLSCSLLIGSTALFPLPATAIAAEPGLITKESRYSLRETIERFEAAVKAKEASGFMVFTEIDHAAAAKRFGLDMLPRTVIVFGNPKSGTAVMQKTPTSRLMCRRGHWSGRMSRAKFGLLTIHLHTWETLSIPGTALIALQQQG